MRKLTILLPEDLHIDSREAKLYLLEKLYEVGKISADQAAKLLGTSRERFMEMLSHSGMSVDFPLRYPGSHI